MEPLSQFTVKRIVVVKNVYKARRISVMRDQACLVARKINKSNSINFPGWSLRHTLANCNPCVGHAWPNFKCSRDDGLSNFRNGTHKRSGISVLFAGWMMVGAKSSLRFPSRQCSQLLTTWCWVKLTPRRSFLSKDQRWNTCHRRSQMLSVL